MPFSPERSKTQSDYVRERKEAIEKREYIARIETELADRKASLPKIKADAVLSLIEAIEGAIDNDFISIKEVEEMHLEDFCELAKRHANKLEAGE